MCIVSARCFRLLRRAPPLIKLEVSANAALIRRPGQEAPDEGHAPDTFAYRVARPWIGCSYGSQNRRRYELRWGSGLFLTFDDTDCAPLPGDIRLDAFRAHLSVVPRIGIAGRRV